MTDSSSDEASEATETGRSVADTSDKVYFKTYHELIKAIYSDDIDQLQHLLQGNCLNTHPALIDIDYVAFKMHGDDPVDQRGDTVIHQAARYGRTKPVEILLKTFLNFRSQEIKASSLPVVLSTLLNRTGETILHAAAAAGQPHAIETVFYQLYNYQPLLTPSEVLARRRLRRMSSVSRGGIDLDDFINAKDGQLKQRTALHLTTFSQLSNPHTQLMAEYLSNGCYGGCSSSPGFGYGTTTRTSGHAMAADLLLHHGASVDEVDMHGFNAFHLAVLNGNLELCKLLYSHCPSIVNEPTSDGWLLPPLHLAIKQAAAVADQTASASTSTSTSASTLRGCQQHQQHLDHLQRHLGVINWLLQSGADRRRRDSAGRLAQETLLVKKAAPFEKKELVKALARFGLHQ